MSINKLALLGGEPTISKKFQPYNVIGQEEINVVNEVMQKGVLSQYVGSWGENFYGGDAVRQLEDNWQKYFSVKRAVCVNSNTSGLIAALGALGVEPGDEVLVTTWTMAASATAILVWNAIPIFVDIEKNTFNMDPNLIEAKITKKTKGIVLPHIFGHPAEFDKIKAIADKYGLFIIEDAAQVPGSFYKNRRVGTMGDIGVFSLNYHKHIHCGEGGVCVTNNDELAERMCLIRNHAEAVVAAKGVSDISNMIGFNFRLTELHAAIAIEQLKKLDKIIAQKRDEAEYLTAGLSDLPGLRCPIEQPECKHVYYMYPMIYDASVLGVSRDLLLKALKAEGVSNVVGGYVNIHRYPMYQQKIAYGQSGFPWAMNENSDSYNYADGICPVAETLQDESFMNLLICFFHYTKEDLDLIIRAFHKVWSNMDNLRQYVAS